MDFFQETVLDYAIQRDVSRMMDQEDELIDLGLLPPRPPIPMPDAETMDVMVRRVHEGLGLKPPETKSKGKSKTKGSKKKKA